MRYLLLICFALSAVAADPAVPVVATDPAPNVEPSRTVTDADLQNLIACARLQLKELTADQIAVVAQAIKHAESDLEASRKAKAIPVEIASKKEP